MTDTPHAAASGPRHRAVELGAAIAMIVFGALIMYGSLQVGIGWAQRDRSRDSSRFISVY